MHFRLAHLEKVCQPNLLLCRLLFRRSHIISRRFAIALLTTTLPEEISLKFQFKGTTTNLSFFGDADRRLLGLRDLDRRGGLLKMLIHVNFAQNQKYLDRDRGERERLSRERDLWLLNLTTSFNSR